MGSSVNDIYEVFLSFRGIDTRQGFTAVLYKCMTSVEINVFKDDDELAIGDKIDSILEAINTPRICIPIFSPRFAESKWCLREVLRMVELKKTIVPIFYKVSPDDVKLKGQSLYLDDFRKHEENHENLEEVERWKKALREAASNKGRSLGDKSYLDFCKEFVDEVLSKLGPRKILHLDYFVGHDNREAIMKLLDMESSSQEVVCVGIYGMGGIGKTTITKLIYNEFRSKFDQCGFVPDIREFTKTKGIQELSNHLLTNIEPKTSTLFSRSNQISSMFKNKKVLLILDDVDSYEQIKAIARDPNWFGSGSRILLTTRDKKVVEDYMDESGHEIQQLEMKGLEHGWGLELFCKCAFGTDSPPSQFTKLSEKVVSYFEGLPLAIDVTGKSLRNQEDVQVWEEVIERLSRCPPKEVMDKLMISYDSLEDEQKTIFLDLACFFLDKYVFELLEMSNLILMWQASNLLPRMSLQVLRSKSFLRIDECNNIRLHDQLRDMGRDIVRKDSKGDITQHSRLWENNDILEVLKSKEKKIKVEAIHIFEDKNIMDYEFLGFNNLRLLALGRSYSYPMRSLLIRPPQKLSGSLPKLVCLSMHSTFDVENLVLPNLVVFHNLRNQSKAKAPLFVQNMRNLKILNIECCYKLPSIDPSIAELQHLTSLNLTGCRALRELPQELGCLRNLIKLDLHDCRNLFTIPESLGNLHSLKELNLSDTSITSLPDSIGRLKKLENLNLRDCKDLVILPKTLGNLRSLTTLNLLNTDALTSLPNSIGNLRSLLLLNISSTIIRELPKLPDSLTKLVMESSALEKVHDLSNLVHLTSLVLVGGDILDWDGSFPENLQYLNIYLLSISRLPDLDNCSQLTKFLLQCESSLMVLPNLAGLRKLKRLEISYCNDLIEIPGIANLHSLTSLHIKGCLKLVSSGNLERIKELIKLHNNVCEIVVENPESGGFHCDFQEHSEDYTADGEDDDEDDKYEDDDEDDKYEDDDEDDKYEDDSEDDECEDDTEDDECEDDDEYKYDEDEDEGKYDEDEDDGEDEDDSENDETT